MEFLDKNGREIKVGDHLAWMRRRYKKPPIRRVGTVTKLKASRLKNGTDSYRIVAHLDFEYPYEYQGSRYVDLPEGVKECKELYVYYRSKDWRGVEHEHSTPCIKAEGHEGEHGRREMEPYTAHSTRREYYFPSFTSREGKFGTIEVVDEPTTTAETMGEGD